MSAIPESRTTLDRVLPFVGTGLGGVELVVSDAHCGLVAAIRVAFQGASWQRCRVHFMRNVLAKVPKTAGPMVAAIIRTVFVPRGKRELVRPSLTRSSPAATPPIPPSPRCWTRPRRTPRIQRLPVPALAADLVHQPAGAPEQGDQTPHRCRRDLPKPGCTPAPGRTVLIEQHDEWDSAERRYFSENSMRLLDHMPLKEVAIPEITAA